MYLSAGEFDAGQRYMRETVHHEMFHLVDAALKTLGDDDIAWSRANPAGFHYGTGGFNPLISPVFLCPPIARRPLFL